METICYGCFCKYEGSEKSLYCPNCRRKRRGQNARNIKLNELGGKAFAEKCAKIREEKPVEIELKPEECTVTIPCRVGDTVWCARDTKIYNKPVKGTVTEIYFRDNMDACIVVRRLCRGRWGERVFATKEEAQAMIDRRLKESG